MPRSKKDLPRTAKKSASRGQGALRPFVDVLPPGAFPGSIEDLKLRFTRRVIYIARRWRNLLDEALRVSGDSHARWLALLWTDLLEGKANHRELAERVGVELPTLVRLLNRLEKEKLVKRRSLGEKGRAKSVVLTDRGRERLDHMSQVVQRTRASFLEGIDEEALRTAVQVLDAVLVKYVTVVDLGMPTPSDRRRIANRAGS